jgi:Primase C terminal 2 (PriCT-2)
MTKKRHVDYVKWYAANLTPVIPHDATLSANSKIAPSERGKVPGQKKPDGTWYGGWKDLGVATMARARMWDAMGAGIGCRGGFGNVASVDVDLTVREDSEKVLAIANEVWGPALSVRRVAHPEHTKLLIEFRIEGLMPASFNVEVMQGDGVRGGIQFLAAGRYWNVHGTHPKRLAPYVWENDPADAQLTLVDLVEFEAFWTRLGQEFKIVRTHKVNASNELQLEPEQCTPEEAEALIALIPNDETFEAYDDFIRMGSAIYGASGGAEWGRAMWIAWCEQADQEQEEKPEIFWDTMLKARIGADMLRRLANERDPLEMARRAFADSPIKDVEPDLVQEANVDADARIVFLDDWCLVGGSEFYSVSHPRRPLSTAAFGLVNAKQEKRLRRALGGDKRLSIAKLFARRGQNMVDDVVHEPGKPRFIERDGQRFLNLWSPPPRPHKDLPIDPDVIEFYRELVAFVLGSAEETELWIKWHAWLLQNPDKAPGWHWIVQTGQGRGKDFILRPIGLAHGDDYTPINPKDLSAPYNDYAEKHLISASEMKERNRDDGYIMLKAITSGAPQIPIRIPYRKRYLAANVAAFVVYSNEERPLKIDHDDRRLHVVSNFSEEKRTPEYYSKALRLLNDNWAMIGEYLLTLPLTDADHDLLTGNAPKSDAKAEMAEQVAEGALRDIIGEIESDKPPPQYLPVATTGDVMDWLKKEHLRPHELPSRQELPGLLYRLGARPLNPNRKKPTRAEPIGGCGRLWRLAKTWVEQGKQWNLESITPARLAKLYSDRAMPPATKGDFKVVDEDEI